ncbi:MAG TPA: hypothetical protein VM681_02690, partial [Candidatus Thermoplasmatota archaeon]|nr:hypothetical protein [Candidatus Thermoplasmatota archaeon]
AALAPRPPPATAPTPAAIAGAPPAAAASAARVVVVRHDPDTVRARIDELVGSSGASLVSQEEARLRDLPGKPTDELRR